jgi:hypothetical protein
MEIRIGALEYVSNLTVAGFHGTLESAANS